MNDELDEADAKTVRALLEEQVAAGSRLELVLGGQVSARVKDLLAPVSADLKASERALQRCQDAGAERERRIGELESVAASLRERVDGFRSADSQFSDRLQHADAVASESLAGLVQVRRELADATAVASTTESGLRTELREEGERRHAALAQLDAKLDAKLDAAQRESLRLVTAEAAARREAARASDVTHARHDADVRDQLRMLQTEQEKCALALDALRAAMDTGSAALVVARDRLAAARTAAADSKTLIASASAASEARLSNLSQRMVRGAWLLGALWAALATAVAWLATMHAHP